MTTFLLPLLIMLPLSAHPFFHPAGVFHRPDMVQMTPPPPAPAPHRKPNCSSADVDLLQTTVQVGKHTPHSSATLQRSSPTACMGLAGTKTRSAGSNCSSGGLVAGTGNGGVTTSVVGGAGGIPPPIPERSSMQATAQRSPSPVMNSPVWLSRHLDGGAGKALLESSSDNLSKNHSADEEDVDTDLETDRLLGHQRLDDQGYYDENKSWDRKTRSSLLSKISPKQQQLPSTKTRNGYNALLSSTPELPPPIPPKSAVSVGSSGAAKLLDLVSSSVQHMQRSTSRSSSERSGKSPINASGVDICGMSAATAAEVVASAVVAAGNLPNLGSPNNGGGSERSAPSVIKLDVDLNGGSSSIINGGSAMPAATCTANGTSNANANQNGGSNGTGNTIGSNNIGINNNINGGSSNNSNGSGTNNNSNANGNSNPNGNNNNNNNNVAVGSNNGSSGSGAGSNSNSGEKKVKKSKSKEGKCLAWVYPSFNCCNFSVSCICIIIAYRNYRIVSCVVSSGSRQ